ncbi:hypothetical protein QBC35DRAFT_415859 [Podospora australis]|uniref:Uncharacterized protein n=1 Tax=Podospora australis TaxID=1536484 RepID=A0AAN6WNC6_9PEZI|nr:hypothetical protein QBC35DRAFT_415859 [Podospora australis]
MMTPFQVTVHPLPTINHVSLTAYERLTSSSTPKNALVFIGGLTSGPHTTPLDFLTTDAVLGNGTWSIWELRMRSSFSGFGYSSLKNDAEDLAVLVSYLRKQGKEKVVFMGCSTGCQDILEYAKTKDTPAVDGYILTSPVSDREAAFLFMKPESLSKSVSVAKNLIDAGKAEEAMPREDLPFIFTTPITAYRWYSLAAVGGDDDFFSSDLPGLHLQKIFGSVNKPILILPAGEDEMVPPTVDRDALLKRWIAACLPGIVREDLSGFVPGADHVISSDDAQRFVAARVGEFLRDLLL